MTLALSPLAGAQPLDGTFHGRISDSPAVLTLSRDGAALHGVIDATGYLYTLEGTATGAAASGTLTDLAAGSTMPFELDARGDELTLAVVATDPLGQVQRVAFSFRRDGPEPAPSPAPAAQGSAERDPALVGRWTFSETYVSGDFSGTTRLYLEVHPDGTYRYGSGSVSIGGATELGSYGGQSGGGDVTQGQWRTEGGVIFVREAGAAAWAPYARYHVEGPRMLFTFDDGSRQLWTRP